ncbi:hypothetical protein EV175_001935 [Coemansia sp. RSA 1933]|nr:hypothetical protein EV175_001935 [Coemansia sp. RSA 1933]
MVFAKTLAGKTAVVIGASGGIGGAIAKELAGRGARLVLCGRNTERLDQIRTSLLPDNSGHSVVPCDILDTQSIDKLARTTREQGGADVLVNSAGISRDSVVARLSCVEETLGTNLVGVMNTCRAFVPQMMRKQRAAIVNVSSVIGLHGNVGQAVYAASKAGVVGFTKSLAREVASRGVSANVVAPGFIATEMTQGVMQSNVTKQLLDRIPMQGPGSVDDVAHAVAFLAEARYITGQVS